MAVETGTATDYQDLLAKLRTFLEVTLPVAERWTALRTDDSTAEHESIWEAPGLAAGDEFYVGIKTYRDVATDVYNWKINGFTGYVSTNSFDGQPGRISSNIGIPLWNVGIPYIFVANHYRCIVSMNIANNYQLMYMGKFLTYATPSQWPYALLIGGMLTTDALTRYDNISYVSFFKGARNNCRMRFVDGLWRTPEVLPFNTNNTHTLRNTKADSTKTEVEMPGYWGIHSLILSENTGEYVNCYGELDGLYYISGFSNAVENTIVIGGETYIILRDVTRTGLEDYIALKLV